MTRLGHHSLIHRWGLPLHTFRSALKFLMTQRGYALATTPKLLSNYFEMTVRSEQPLLRTFYTLTFLNEGIFVRVWGLKQISGSIHRIEWSQIVSLEDLVIPNQAKADGEAYECRFTRIYEEGVYWAPSISSLVRRCKLSKWSPVINGYEIFRWSYYHVGLSRSRVP